MTRPVVVCVDDEHAILLGLKQEVEVMLGEAFDVEIAESGEEALQLIQQLLAEGTEVPVVVTDQVMPGMMGDELIVQLREITPETKTILLTGQAAPDAVGNALNRGRLFRFIAKPWETHDLRMTIQQAVEAFFRDAQLTKRRAELRQLTDNFRTLSQVAMTHELGQTFLTLLLNDTSAEVGILFSPDAFGDLAPSLVLRQEGAFLRASDDGHDYPVDVVNLAWISHEPAYEPNLEGGRSCLACQLAQGDQVYGGFYLEWPTEDALSEAQQHFLKLMTNGALPYFESARLFQDLEATVARRNAEMEEQNTEIGASIRYAKRIQEAFLASEEELYRTFPEAFVVFKPLGDVSGDFYWIHSFHGKHFLAVGDATGVGVPAALLSMQVCTHLNLLVGENALSDPAEILKALHARMRETLSQELANGDEVLHGVSLALCRLDEADRKLAYAGANMPLMHVHKGNMNELKGRKELIGLATSEKLISIKTEEVQLAVGDRIFLATDGCVLQAGGPGGDAFGGKRLRELLANTHSQSLRAQRELYLKSIREWQGTTPQTDDRLLIGLEVA